jgi:hypothetical protein
MPTKCCTTLRPTPRSSPALTELGGEGQFDWHITPNEGQGGSTALETDPRRFAMYVDYNEEMSVYAIQDHASH